MSADNILDCPMAENDAGATTVRGYFAALAVQVWLQGEGFGGKRPFGDSGWEYQITDALEAAGIEASDTQIAEAIASMGRA